MTTYRGPASSVTLPDGTVVKPGDEVRLDPATQKALEDAGHSFGDTPTEHAPQQAGENLAADGTTAEQQAADAGLSVGTTPESPPSTPPATPPRAPKT